MSFTQHIKTSIPSSAQKIVLTEIENLITRETGKIIMNSNTKIPIPSTISKIIMGRIISKNIMKNIFKNKNTKNIQNSKNSTTPKHNSTK